MRPSSAWSWQHGFIDAVGDRIADGNRAAQLLRELAGVFDSLFRKAQADFLVGRREHDLRERAMPVVLHGLSPFLDWCRAAGVIAPW